MERNEGEEGEVLLTTFLTLPLHPLPHCLSLLPHPHPSPREISREEEEGGREVVSMTERKEEDR
jgi:hypothetical protein